MCEVVCDPSNIAVIFDEGNVKDLYCQYITFPAKLYLHFRDKVTEATERSNDTYTPLKYLIITQMFTHKRY